MGVETTLVGSFVLQRLFPWDVFQVLSSRGPLGWHGVSEVFNSSDRRSYAKFPKNPKTNLQRLVRFNWSGKAEGHFWHHRELALPKYLHAQDYSVRLPHFNAYVNRRLLGDEGNRVLISRAQPSLGLESQNLSFICAAATAKSTYHWHILRQLYLELLLLKNRFPFWFAHPLLRESLERAKLCRTYLYPFY